MRNAHFRTGLWGEKCKTWKMRHKHCRTWKMVRKLTNEENEKDTWQDLEYIQKTEKHGK